MDIISTHATPWVNFKCVNTKCKTPDSKVFILYDILEKTKIQGQKTDKSFQGLGGERSSDDNRIARGNLGA